MGPPSTGTNKMLEKLERSFEAGNFYEAQQMYKSVHKRYLASGKVGEAMDLVQSGACTQLRHGQDECGTELALLLVETLKSTGTPFGPDSIERLRAVLDAFLQGGQETEEAGAAAPAALREGGEGPGEVVGEKLSVLAKDRTKGCTSFLKHAIQWSAGAGAPTEGAPVLHDMLADFLWNHSPEKDLVAASRHFVLGSRPAAFASALVDVMRACYPGEIDLVIARGVLQYLAVGNLRDANELLDDLQQRSGSFAAPPIPDTPLMHFIRFLLLTLERDALVLFRMLRNKYRPSLERDPTFSEYLDAIALRFFNVHPQQGGIQGMLGNIMKIFGGEDDLAG